MADVVRLLIGIVTLVVGAEVLVGGSRALALRFGVGRLVVGLTVVAFGTSAPELAVSLRAALTDQGDIAVGNVVGSNIANVLLILGVCAVIRPLDVHRKVVRIDIPLMIGASVLAWVLLADGRLSRVEGLALLAGIALYTSVSVVLARRESVASTAATPPDERARPPLRSVSMILLGLAGLAFGAELFVAGASGIARAFGVSQAVIGLTVVAVGTSLPELATSVLAAVRGESDIAVGNVVGSNIFNLLAILGISAGARPLATSGVGVLDLGAMLGAAVLLLPLAHSGTKLGRIEAGSFLLLYGVYVWLRAGGVVP